MEQHWSLRLQNFQVATSLVSELKMLTKSIRRLLISLKHTVRIQCLVSKSNLKMSTQTSQVLLFLRSKIT